MSHITNKIFDALADEKRRRLLFALVEKNSQTEVPITEGFPIDTSSIEYQHCHLPKLDDYGFIEWTPSTNCVERGPQFEDIRPILLFLSEDCNELPVEQ
ncbi:hypothetical protein SAMN04515672_0881 [Natronorubrum texcoconense]|uniref:Helix-turn-helix domain-containing protein n=1 Tax=Natronorubrum texcoconense TaxID=1095776 RepID=A0A1G8UGP7_9EURY|nr:hypothetical protein SAMN04515672_0881 [Natronorubrum texcoconense]